ncbi:hypothetical protein K458DRAFT_287043 [Lentithecium fluviatile CBS 122367]|uniref:Uncharacterized protein n=1 Tax=Lentithecium fluviatile CBS 122367 TaxID=1168545 RepID=A0A6G1JLG2_9PLEO|nr:hypothetical protein K458DRAFT_287043 [Lentithecium fluviatile CBS 122367]
MDEPPNSGHTESPVFTKTDYSYVGGGGGGYQGSTFDSDTRSLLSQAKRYDHHESRLFLLKTGAYRFLMTLAFSLAIGVSLKSYEGFGAPFIMNKTQVRIFNSLMLGLSLGLGLNLASSLKRYAVILRWYLLTRRYVSLEVFDLILGLETLTKVGKLLIISLPGIRRIKLLRKLPWFREARDDGTRFTWIACALWILINIGAQILVAALSLFWPVDPSDAMPLLTYGNVTVANLNVWSSETPDSTWWSNSTSMEAAWVAGMEAIVYPTFPTNETKHDLSSLPGTPLYKGNGYYEYRFYNRDPQHEYTNYVVSQRSVQAKATCQQLELNGTIVENPTDGPMYIVGREEGKAWARYPIPQRTTGSFSWSGSTYAFCGPRCTNFTVYQDNDTIDIKTPSLFLCDSTLSPVTIASEEFVNLKPQDKEHIYGNDDFARIAAGAMAWTGYELNGWDDRQTRSYLRGSKWSPYKMLQKEDIEDLISRFTIGAVAAFDDHGIRYTIPNQSNRPIQGQQLQVDWSYVLVLLGSICFIQFAALCCLLAFGNKSIIRDESFFSMAMLLSPVVNRIGKVGMNLSGDEIKQHPKLLWKRIRYDYREGKDGEPNVVDIFFQGRDNAEVRRSWAPGVYS